VLSDADVDYFDGSPNNNPNTSPPADAPEKFAETQFANLNHIGTWTVSDPKIHEGDILIIDDLEAHPAQQERNANLPQAHDNRSSTGCMLEIYLKQDEQKEPWKPRQKHQ
jgi:hypothetical protein